MLLDKQTGSIDPDIAFTRATVYSPDGEFFLYQEETDGKAAGTFIFHKEDAYWLIAALKEFIEKC